MSAAAINLVGEVRMPGSGSVLLDCPAPSADALAPDSAMGQGSPQGDNQAPCDEAAREGVLVAAAKRGDQHAFVALCSCHSPSLKRRIRQIVRNSEDAEDVLQETLCRAFSGLGGFRAKCSFRTWIMTIATNTSLMLLRKQRIRREIGFGLVTAEGQEVEILQLSDPMPNPEQVYATRQAHHRLSEAVRMLPPGTRLLVEHYHKDEVTLTDAANAIGITEAAAKSRLMRARNTLRRSLKQS